MSRLISCDKLHNIRDLGGMETIDGRTIKTGKLIRCGHLSELSDNDCDTLLSLSGGMAGSFLTERETEPEKIKYI